MEREHKALYQRGLEHLKAALIAAAEAKERELTVAIGERHKAKQALEVAQAKFVEAQNAHAAAERLVTVHETECRRLEQEKSQVIWLLREEF